MSNYTTVPVGDTLKRITKNSRVRTHTNRNSCKNRKEWRCLVCKSKLQGRIGDYCLRCYKDAATQIEIQDESRFIRSRFRTQFNP